MDQTLKAIFNSIFLGSTTVVSTIKNEYGTKTYHTVDIKVFMEDYQHLKGSILVTDKPIEDSFLDFFSLIMANSKQEFENIKMAEHKNIIFIYLTRYSMKNYEVTEVKSFLKKIKSDKLNFPPEPPPELLKKKVTPSPPESPPLEKKSPPLEKKSPPLKKKVTPSPPESPPLKKKSPSLEKKVSPSPPLEKKVSPSPPLKKKSPPEIILDASEMTLIKESRKPPEIILGNLISIENDEGIEKPIGEEVELVEEEDIKDINLNFLSGVIIPEFEIGDSPEQRGKKFKNFLNTITTALRINEKIRKKLFTVENLRDVWKLAFTHPSYDPDNNYETLEALGDAELRYVFKQYLYNRYPDITEGELNDLDNKYMSTQHQSILGKALKLDKWLIKSDNFDVTSSIFEDIFESFCGAIDKCMGGKKSSTVLHSIIELIYNDFNFPRGKDAQNSRPVFEQIFNRIGKSSKKYYIAEPQKHLEEGNWMTKITLTEDAKKLLNRHGIEIKAKSFEVKKGSKKISSNLCYTHIVKYLRNQGLTEDLINKITIEKESSDKNYNTALTKVQKQNHEVFRITNKVFINNDINKRTSQLIGITSSGKKIVIFDKKYLLGQESKGWWGTLLEDFINS